MVEHGIPYRDRRCILTFNYERLRMFSMFRVVYAHAMQLEGEYTQGCVYSLVELSAPRSEAVPLLRVS